MIGTVLTFIFIILSSATAEAQELRRSYSRISDAWMESYDDDLDRVRAINANNLISLHDERRAEHSVAIGKLLDASVDCTNALLDYQRLRKEARTVQFDITTSTGVILQSAGGRASKAMADVQSEAIARAEAIREEMQTVYDTMADSNERYREATQLVQDAKDRLREVEDAIDQLDDIPEMSVDTYYADGRREPDAISFLDADLQARYREDGVCPLIIPDFPG